MLLQQSPALCDGVSVQVVGMVRRDKQGMLVRQEDMVSIRGRMRRVLLVSKPSQARLAYTLSRQRFAWASVIPEKVQSCRVRVLIELATQVPAMPVL